MCKQSRTIRQIAGVVAVIFTCFGAAVSQQTGQKQSPNRKPIPLKTLLGEWKEQVGETKINISAVDEKTVILKGELEWRGTYENGQLILTTQPPASAMNPAIPEDARKDVQSRLTWQMTIEPFEGVDGLEMKGEFRPGVVEWEEVSGAPGEKPKMTGKVTGAAGTPISLRYEKALKWEIADAITFSEHEARALLRFAESDLTNAPAKPGDGPDIYYLFVYGPRLPTRESQVKSLQSADSGIRLRPFAFESPASGVFAPQAWKSALLKEGWKLAKDGLPSKQQEQMKDWNALLLTAEVSGPVTPGWQEFTLNGVDWGWYLDQGNIAASVELVKSAPDEVQAGKFEPASLLYAPGQFRVRVETKADVPFPSISILIGHNGRPQLIEGQETIVAERVSNRVFETAPIYLASNEQPGIATRETAEPHRFALQVKTGDVISCEFADPALFHVIPAQSQALVWAPGKNLWIDALERATRKSIPLETSPNELADIGKQPTATFEDVTVSYGTYRLFVAPWTGGVLKTLNREFIQRIKVTAGTQAAMILLKDEMIDQLSAYRASMSELKDDQAALAYLRQIEPHIKNDLGWLLGREHDPAQALAYMEINPNYLNDRLKIPAAFAQALGRKEPRLRDAFRAEMVKTFPNREAWEKWMIPILKETYAKHQDAVDHSLTKLQLLNDNDVKGLLEMTGNGLGPVIESLLPKLVRPTFDSKTRSSNWMPDRVARAEVLTVNDTWARIRAQREWAAADANFAFAIAGLVPNPLPSFVMKAFTLADSAATQIGERQKHQEEARFAMGLAPVVGTERWMMADMQRTEMWQIALNLIAMEAQGQALQAFGRGLNRGLTKVMGAMTRTEAIRRALKVLSQKPQMTGRDILGLAPADQAAFLLVAGSAEIAQRAGRSTSSLQERVGGAWQSLAQETAAARLNNPRVPEPLPAANQAATPPVSGREPHGELIRLGDLGKLTSKELLARTPSLLGNRNSIPLLAKMQRSRPPARRPAPPPTKPPNGVAPIVREPSPPEPANAFGESEWKEGEVLTIPDAEGHMIELARNLGKGEYAMVYEADFPKGRGAVKIMIDKEAGLIMNESFRDKLPDVIDGTPIHSGNQTMSDIEVGENCAKKLDIPYAASLKYYDEHQPVMIQYVIDEISGQLEWGRSVVQGGKFPLDKAIAFAQGIKKLRDAGFVWTDPNLKNYVFRTRQAKPEIALVDLDKLCPFNQPTDRVALELFTLEREGVPGVQWLTPVSNRGGLSPMKRLVDLDTVWIVILLDKGYITFDGVSLRDGLIPIKVAAQIIPDIESRKPVDLRNLINPQLPR